LRLTWLGTSLAVYFKPDAASEMEPAAPETEPETALPASSAVPITRSLRSEAALPTLPTWRRATLPGLTASPRALTLRLRSLRVCSISVCGWTLADRLLIEEFTAETIWRLPLEDARSAGLSGQSPPSGGPASCPTGVVGCCVTRRVRNARYLPSCLR